jgi:hypothetical protein
VTSKPLIARRGTEHGSGPGTQRSVMERAFAHLHALVCVQDLGY